MKYEKPMVAVERYELSQAIASCSIKVGPDGTNWCIMESPNTPDEMRSWAYIGYFGTTEGCLQVPDIGDQYAGICYHTQANAAFIS